MFVLTLVRKSLANRALASTLTLLSIALSVALLLGIENVRTGMRQSFSNTISRTDLIVGGRGGSLPLLLYSVFGIGSPVNNISWETYERFRDHPAVAWTIPISLGDSHRGFRVVGTDSSFYRHFRYGQGREVRLAQGTEARDVFDVVLGHQAAAELGYGLGSEVVITHGLHGTGIMDHDDHPFLVVGILERTFTPVDRSLYVTLQGIDAMHEDFMADPFAPPGGGGARPDFSGGAQPDLSGAAPPPAIGTGTTQDDAQRAAAGHDHVHAPPADAAAARGQDAPPDHGHDHAHEQAHEHAHAHDAGAAPEQITAFFLGATTRIATLQLQREINTYEGEPVTAIMPGVALAEMWRGVGYAEDALRIVTFFVVGVGLIGMLLSLYSSLEARRREMAILRAVGTGAPRIVLLLVLESGLLGIAGVLTGVGLVYALLLLLAGFVETNFGLYLPIVAPSATGYMYLGAVVVASFLIGLVPALKAYRNSLADGLSVRV
jgi:putative ABC transport system permease protein